MTVVPEVRTEKCTHLGSQRRCCGDLYICRESPRCSCILAGFPTPPLRSCETCERYVPIEKVSKITS